MRKICDSPVLVIVNHAVIHCNSKHQQYYDPITTEAEYLPSVFATLHRALHVVYFIVSYANWDL